MKPSFFISTAIVTTFLSISCNHHHISCDDLKKGKFLFHSSISNRKYFIERSDSIQIEVDDSTKRTTKCKIIWVNDCEYYLTSLPDSSKSHDSIDSFFESTPIKTTIIEVTSTYYVFSSKIGSLGKKLVLTDTMNILR